MRALRLAAFWVPFVVVTWLALTPSPPESVAHISDIVLHALAFTVLTGALSFAHYRLSAWPAWAWMLAYGAALEVVQGITGRSPEWKDLIVDAIGIACAVLLLRWLPVSWRNWWNRRFS